MSSVERIYLYIKYGKNGSLNYTYLRERRYIMQFQILKSARQLRYPRKKPKQNLADGETDPHNNIIMRVRLCTAKRAPQKNIHEYVRRNDRWGGERPRRKRTHISSIIIVIVVFCLSISRVKNQYGHWVCWMSTSRRTV